MSFWGEIPKRIIGKFWSIIGSALAFAALTHGLMSHWAYQLRITEGLAPLLQPLKEIIRHHFLPSLIGRDASTDAERKLLVLPACLGGLGLVNPPP